MCERCLVPKLRFHGFDNKWESKKLKDLSKIQRGASPRPINDKKWYDSESKRLVGLELGMLQVVLNI